MKMTTDGTEAMTLAELVAGHGKDLLRRIDEAQKKPGAAGVREADGLFQKLKKLSTQAGAVGYRLDGDKKPQTKLEELRETLRKAGRNA